MGDIDIPLLLRALDFYYKSPDGQYDLSVVVPLIEKELMTRPVTEGEGFTELRLPRDPK